MHINRNNTAIACNIQKQLLEHIPDSEGVYLQNKFQTHLKFETLAVGTKLACLQFSNHM